MIFLSRLVLIASDVSIFLKEKVRHTTQTSAGSWDGGQEGMNNDAKNLKKKWSGGAIG
jgi:hypothetical protein